VDLTPVDMLGASVTTTIQAALDAVNLVTQGKGKGLYFGHKFVPNPDNQAGPKLSGKPQPGGPACEWALGHLTQIVRAAYSADIVSIRTRRTRMLALAEQIESCLRDLCRSDWRSEGEEGVLRQASLPMRLSRLAIQWVFTHDTLSPKHYGQYYLHDIISHMGHLYLSMRARGFSGLGEIDNSVLEHHHQEIGTLFGVSGLLIVFLRNTCGQSCGLYAWFFCLSVGGSGIFVDLS
jgi:hypothetical protein